MSRALLTFTTIHNRQSSLERRVGPSEEDWEGCGREGPRLLLKRACSTHEDDSMVFAGADKCRWSRPSFAVKKQPMTWCTGSWEGRSTVTGYVRLDAHPNGVSSSGRRVTPLTPFYLFFLLRVKNRPLLDWLTLRSCAESAHGLSCEVEIFLWNGERSRDQTIALATYIETEFYTY
jgi:hypothetical protein